MENKSQKVKIIINGPPASGKSTQANFLVQQTQAILISPSALVHAATKSQTDEGKQIKSYVYSSKDIPPSLTFNLIDKFIKEMDGLQKGWILYRGPLSVEEATYFVEKGIIPDLYIHLDVNEETLLSRVNKRRVDSLTHKVYNLESNVPQDPEIQKRLVHKFGDDSEIFKERIKRYNSKISAVLDFFKQHSKVVHIDASISLQQVEEQIRKEIETVYNQLIKEK